MFYSHLVQLSSRAGCGRDGALNLATLAAESVCVCECVQSTQIAFAYFTRPFGRPGRIRNGIDRAENRKF